MTCMGKVTIRLGLGRSPSGKVLDKDTQWFNDKNLAIKEWERNKKRIFVSVGGKGYKEVSLEYLISL